MTCVPIFNNVILIRTLLQHLSGFTHYRGGKFGVNGDKILIS